MAVIHALAPAAAANENICGIAHGPSADYTDFFLPIRAIRAIREQFSG
jgi:hypothetical protein